MFLLAESLISLRLLTNVPLTRAVAHQYDSHGMVAHAVANFAHESKSVIALGGSALREALPPDSVVQDAISEALVRKVQFRNLATSSQTISESLLVTGNLLDAGKLRNGDVVLLHVNPNRFSSGAEDALQEYYASRMPLLDPAPLGDFLKQNGIAVSYVPRVWQQRLAIRQYLKGLLPDHVRQCLRKVGRLEVDNSCLGGVSASADPMAEGYIQYAYKGEPMERAQKEVIAREIARTKLVRVRRNMDFSIAIAAHIIHVARERGVAVVLLDLPRDPLSLEAYLAVNNLYRATIRALTSQGAYYLGFPDPLEFPSAVFYDLDHLLPSERGKIANALANRLQQISPIGSDPSND